MLNITIIPPKIVKFVGCSPIPIHIQIGPKTLSKSKIKLTFVALVYLEARDSKYIGNGNMNIPVKTIGKTLPFNMFWKPVMNNPTIPDKKTPILIGKTKGNCVLWRIITKVIAIVIAAPNPQNAPITEGISIYIKLELSPDPKIAIDIPIKTEIIATQVDFCVGSFSIISPKIAANIGAVATQNNTTGTGAMEIPIQNRIPLMK